MSRVGMVVGLLLVIILVVAIVFVSISNNNSNSDSINNDNADINEENFIDNVDDEFNIENDTEVEIGNIIE